MNFSVRVFVFGGRVACVEERESKTARKMAALVSFLARPKPRIPFLGLSLLRNQTEKLATQARARLVVFVFVSPQSAWLIQWTRMYPG